MDTLKPVDKKFRTLVNSHVASGRSGYLLCSQHAKYWCDHIAAVMRSGDDAASIFADYRELVRDLHIGVPLVPSRNIYALVWCEMSGGGEFKVYLNSPSDATQNQMVGEGGTFLGFLSEGEGRNVLRKMILMDFAADYEDTLYPSAGCKSTAHNGFTQGAITVEFKRDATARLAHGWCMRFYKKCFSCFAAEGPEINFAPDLVPEM